jgi:hypothetical protein
MAIIKKKFKPTYKKNNGLFVINLDNFPALPFPIKEKSVVNIPPEQMGGNHLHPRWEAFVGIGTELLLIWEDKAGDKHQEQMNKSKELFLFIVEPDTPHAVINQDKNDKGLLIELASEVQHDVEKVELFNE